MSELAEIDRLASALLQRVAPAARRKLLRVVARDVRKSQSERIGRQVQPDGSAFAPRKAPRQAQARRGQLRRKTMFARLRTTKFLRGGATAEEAWIGFSGRGAKIASVHQEGGEDAPTRGARKIRYTRRVLLGLTEAEQGMVLDRLLEMVTAG